MHIFITGGTRGIGNGVVKEFLKNGHQVSFTGTSVDSLEKAKKSLKGDFFGIVCDVRDLQSFTNAFKEATKKFNDIDIWINNAGVSHSNLVIDELDEVEIKKVIDTNVLGTIYGTRLAIKQFKKQNKGIVYNLEGLGSNGMIIRKTIVYGSSKRLISYFTKACQKEYSKEKNIKFGTIQPGMVFTDLLLGNMPEDGMKVAKIMGSEVSYAAKKIYLGIIKGKKKIKVTNTFKILWKFLSGHKSK